MVLPRHPWGPRFCSWIRQNAAARRNRELNSGETSYQKSTEWNDLPLATVWYYGINAAIVSDLDRADVSDFERGRRDPDLLTLLSYCRLANVYLDVLVDDELDLPKELLR